MTTSRCTNSAAIRPPGYGDPAVQTRGRWRERSPLPLVFGTVIALLAGVTVSCGSSSTESSARSSTCGYVYRVTVSGHTSTLGSCAGTLPSGPTKTISIRIGQDFSIVSIKDAQGKPVYPAPTPADTSVVAATLTPAGAIYRGMATGSTVLSTTSPVCGAGVGSRCPVMEVSVS